MTTLLATLLRGYQVEVDGNSIVSGKHPYKHRHPVYSMVASSSAVLERAAAEIDAVLGALSSQWWLMVKNAVIYLAKPDSKRYLKYDNSYWVDKINTPYLQPHADTRIICQPADTAAVQLIVRLLALPILPQWQASSWLATIDTHTTAPPKVSRVAIPRDIRAKVWRTWNGNSLDGKCFCCQKDIDYDHFECGHIVSASHGGADDPHNYRPICHDCNSWAGGMSNANMYEYMISHNTVGVQQLDEQQPEVLAAKMMVHLTAIVLDMAKHQHNSTVEQRAALTSSLNIRIPMAQRWHIIEQALSAWKLMCQQ